MALSRWIGVVLWPLKVGTGPLVVPWSLLSPPLKAQQRVSCLDSTAGARMGVDGVDGVDGVKGIGRWRLWPQQGMDVCMRICGCRGTEGWFMLGKNGSTNYLASRKQWTGTYPLSRIFSASSEATLLIAVLLLAAFCSLRNGPHTCTCRSSCGLPGCMHAWGQLTWVTGVAATCAPKLPLKLHRFRLAQRPVLQAG